MTSVLAADLRTRAELAINFLAQAEAASIDIGRKCARDGRSSSGKYGKRAERQRQAATVIKELLAKLAAGDAARAALRDALGALMETWNVRARAQAFPGSADEYAYINGVRGTLQSCRSDLDDVLLAASAPERTT